MPTEALTYGVLCGLLLSCIAGGLWASKRREHIRAQRFHTRTVIPVERIRREWYPHLDAESFGFIWREIAHAVHIDAGLIRPHDRFKEDLGSVYGFPVGGDSDDLAEAFCRRCKAKGLDPQRVIVVTVDDYINLFI